MLIATLKFVRLGKGIVATHGITTAMFRSKEIERALNDLCSLHCYIFDGVDPPPRRKFTYLMCYVATSILLDNTAPLIAEASRSSGAVLGIALGTHYKVVTLLIETSTAVSLIYLQSAMQETNEILRRRFRRADEGRRVVRLGVSVVEKHSIDVKSMLEDCRKTRRTVREIVHRLGSLHGVQWLTTVITNQMSCLLYAYACFSVILENRDRTFDGGERWRLFVLVTSCSWCFAKVCVIFHAFEMIVKEIQITAFYVASLDASIIDRPSKLAALEFLEEIRGDEVRFVACSHLSMDHPDLYGVLNDTVNYIIVVLQYLNV